MDVAAPPTGTARRSPGRRPGTSPTASGCCPPAKRQALSAVYAFARRIDDIGDGDAARRGQAGRAGRGPDRRAGAAPAAAAGDDPVLVALADAAARFPIPLAAFGELIDGCEAGRRGAPATPPSTTCCTTAGAWPARSGGSRWACSAPPTRTSRRCRWPTRSASRCSSPTSCATSARTTGTAGSTCRRGPRPVRLHAAAGRPRRSSTPQAGRARPGWSGSRRSAPAAGTRPGLRLMPLLDRRSAASAGAMAGIYRAAARPHRRRPAARCCQRPALAVRRREGRGGRPVARWRPARPARERRPGKAA